MSGKRATSFVSRAHRRRDDAYYEKHRRREVRQLHRPRGWRDDCIDDKRSNCDKLREHNKYHGRKMKIAGTIAAAPFYQVETRATLLKLPLYLACTIHRQAKRVRYCTRETGIYHLLYFLPSSFPLSYRRIFILLALDYNSSARILFLLFYVFDHQSGQREGDYPRASGAKCWQDFEHRGFVMALSLSRSDRGSAGIVQEIIGKYCGGFRFFLAISFLYKKKIKIKKGEEFVR